jgi:hypothetical protein
MERRSFLLGTLVQALCVAGALMAGGAAAEPGTGPHGTVDQSFTTTRPGSPTGLGFSNSWHAAGDPQGKPPFLRRMVIHPPTGMQYDTTVPDLCTASDFELAMRGPAACPPGSKIGDGTTKGEVLAPGADDVVLDPYTHPLHILNNLNEQIVLVESEGYTVVRGKFRPDGALEFNQPTCFPSPPGQDCLDDHVRQLSTTTFVPEYTETAGGVLRSYAVTPSACPRSGHWSTTVELTWSNGSVDSVVTTQPCSRKKRA